jgi:hypothetical protein
MNKMKLGITPLAMAMVISLFSSCNSTPKETKEAEVSASGFNGKIALDVRDSKAD